MAGLASYPAVVYRHTGSKRSRDVTVVAWNRIGDELEAAQVVLGVNPHKGFATVAARFDAIEGSLANVQGALINLFITNDPTTPGSKVTVTFDLLSIEGQTATAATLTINGGTTGANALDTGVLAKGWYHIWAGFNPSTGVVAGLLSLAGNARAGITAPTGYTKWRRVGAVYYDAANFYRFSQSDQECRYDYDASAAYPTTHTLQSGLSVATSSVPTACSNHFPITARRGWVMAGYSVAPSAISGARFLVFPKGGANTGGFPLLWDAWTQGTSVSPIRQDTWVPLDSSQGFYVKWSGAPGTSTNVAIDALGYYDPV